MITRLCSSVRGYIGGFALGIGCVGILIAILLLPLSLFGHSFWTGFSPDGPGMPPAEREAAIAEAIQSDLLYRFAPLLFGSVALIVYGFYEAGKEKVRV